MNKIIMLYRIFLLVLLLSCTLLSQNKIKITSPDRKTRVVINNYKNGIESKLSIFNKAGKILFDTNYISQDHQHGFEIIQTGWTPNSKYFVFSLVSSSGHQPWHYPIFIYSISKRKLVNLDKIIGTVTSGFHLTPPDSLETRVFKHNINEQKEIKIKLSDLN